MVAGFYSFSRPWCDGAAAENRERFNVDDQRTRVWESEGYRFKPVLACPREPCCLKRIMILCTTLAPFAKCAILTCSIFCLFNCYSLRVQVLFYLVAL